MADEIDPLEAFGGDLSENSGEEAAGGGDDAAADPTGGLISPEELASAFGGDLDSFFEESSDAGGGDAGGVLDGDASFGMSNDDIAAAAFGDIIGNGSPAKGGDRNLDMVFEIPVKVAVELGDTTITIKDLLGFGPGSVLELQKLAGEPANLVVNGVLVGKGDVVVVNENYGLRITELISSEDRIKNLSQ